MEQRILQNTAARLRVLCRDADGEFADPGASCTVVVTRASGTALASGSATKLSTGIWYYDLTVAQTLALDELQAVWTGADGSIRTTFHPVCGSWFWSASTARAIDPSLADQSQYTDEDIQLKRLEVERECEAICDRAFVPRFRRITLDGSGTSELLLPVGDIRSIRSIQIYTRAGSSVYRALTEDQLASLVWERGTPLNPGDSHIRRTDNRAFDEGYGNVVVEVEYGLDQPPEDLVRATLKRLRWSLNAATGRIPDRATSFTAENGQTFRLDLPGAYKTGQPEIDAVYQRYSRRMRGSGDKHAPASRQLRMPASRYSIYHR